MKKLFIAISVFGLGAMLSSCDLELYPETGYNEGNVEVPEGPTESAIKTKADVAGERTAMYNYLRGDFQDANYKHLTANACRADDAYGAGDSGKPTEMEANTFTSDNEFPNTFWTGFMNGVSKANNVICNLDAVRENDPTLSETEYNEWMAEALCVRAYMWLLMTQYFGEIPMLTAIPPAINADNVEEVYPLYFPQRVDAETLKAQLEKDLAFACQYAPEPQSVEKDFASKGFAQFLVAKMYSLKQYRDWNKVKAACEAIEAMGYQLEPSYATLWEFDLDAETAKAKGIAYKKSTVSMMYSGRYMAENTEYDGICKVLAEEKTGKIIGVHMLGTYSSEIIFSAAMMVECEMRINDVKEFVFPHPTVCEVVREAVFKMK